MKKLVLMKIARIVLLVAVLLALLMFGCPIYELFDVQCPCCGVTRAWLAFLRGDLSLALRYHALFWAIPALGVIYVYQCFRSSRAKRLLQVTAYIIAAALVVYAILRWCGLVVMP